MERDITEADWKVFKVLKELALDRYCARVLAELKTAINDQGHSNHERYLAVFRLLSERNDELARAFDYHARSKASLQLTYMRRLKLITDEEFSRFSPAYRELIDRWLGFVN